MEVEKKLKVTLNEVEVKDLQVLLGFSTISQAVRSVDKYPKGFEPYEIKKAYEIYEKIMDL